MWGLLPLAVRAKIVKDTKKMIKKLMRVNGFTEDKELQEALKDPGVKEYLDLEISGNESDSDTTVLGDDEDAGGPGENPHGEDTEAPGSSEGQGDGGEAGESGEVGLEEVARKGVGNRD